MPRPKYCWDSSVFIALLTGEERAEGETEGLLEIVDAADCGKAVIVASAQVMTEVLPDLDDPTVSRRLEDLFKRAAFQMFDINQPILTKARNIRRLGRQNGRSIKSPDAVIAATAIIHEVDALHTFDGQLLNLSGEPEVDGLVICKPQGSQTILRLQ